MLMSNKNCLRKYSLSRTLRNPETASISLFHGKKIGVKMTVE